MAWLHNQTLQFYKNTEILPILWQSFRANTASFATRLSRLRWCRIPQTAMWTTKNNLFIPYTPDTHKNFHIKFENICLFLGKLIIKGHIEPGTISGSSLILGHCCFQRPGTARPGFLQRPDGTTGPVRKRLKAKILFFSGTLYSTRSPAMWRWTSSNNACGIWMRKSLPAAFISSVAMELP